MGCPPSPCATCPAHCCKAHRVQVDGLDLPRLVRGLRAPWHDIAEPEIFSRVVAGAFRLDRAQRSVIFYLRQRRLPEGLPACHFLENSADGGLRCGVYALRPSACRIYPLVASSLEEHGAWVWGMARCPEPSRAAFTAALPQLRPVIDEDNAHGHLHRQILERWNAHAAELPEGALAVYDLVGWLLRLYDALAPIREGSGLLSRESVQRAGAAISAFPLPR